MFINNIPKSQAQQAREEKIELLSQQLIEKLQGRELEDLICLKALSLKERKEEIGRLVKTTRKFNIACLSQKRIGNCLEVAIDLSAERYLNQKQFFVDFIKIPDHVLQMLDERQKQKDHESILRM